MDELRLSSSCTSPVICENLKISYVIIINKSWAKWFLRESTNSIISSIKVYYFLTRKEDNFKSTETPFPFTAMCNFHDNSQHQRKRYSLVIGVFVNKASKHSKKKKKEEIGTRISLYFLFPFSHHNNAVSFTLRYENKHCGLPLRVSSMQGLADSQKWKPAAYNFFENV